MSKEAIKRKKKFTDSAMDDGKKVLCFIGGVVLGNTAGNILDSTLKVDETTGMVKKLISPIALVGAGLYGSHHFRDNETIKLVSMGVAGAGAARAVKVFIKKDVLVGLSFGSKAAGTSGLGEGDGNDPIKLQIREFVPDLPKLLNGGDENGGEGDNTPNVTAKMLTQKEATRQIMDGYQEIGNADIEIL